MLLFCIFLLILNNPKQSTDDEGSFEGIIHPKMKIQSLSTHPHTDGRLGEVHKKTARVSQGKGVIVTPQIIKVNGDQYLNVCEKNGTNAMFLASLLTVACSSRDQSQVHVQAFLDELLLRENKVFEVP